MLTSAKFKIGYYEREGEKRLKGVYRSPRYMTDYHKEFRLKEKAKCFKTCSKCGEPKLISKFSDDRRNPEFRRTKLKN